MELTDSGVPQMSDKPIKVLFVCLGNIVDLLPQKAFLEILFTRLV